MCRWPRMSEDFDYTRPRRIADAWGHFAPELLSISIVAAIAIGLHPPPHALALTVPLALAGFVVASWVLMRRHDRRLCDQCVASLPLNPGEQASHYRRRLLLAHAVSRPRFLLPYLLVLIGTNLATGLVGRVVWATAQSSMIYLLLSHSTHRRLQPWCPTCRTDGGGTHDDDKPVPVLPNDSKLV